MIDKEVVAGLLPVFTTGGFILGLWLMWLIEVKPLQTLAEDRLDIAERHRRDAKKWRTFFLEEKAEHNKAECERDALEQRCQYLESQRNSLCGIRDVSVEHDALKAEHYKLRQSRDATEFERNALREQLRTIREAVIDDADVKRVVVMEDA